MRNLDSPLMIEHFRNQVHLTARSNRAVSQVPRFLFCQLNQLQRGVSGNRRMSHKYGAELGDLRDRGEILQRVVGQLGM